MVTTALLALVLSTILPTALSAPFAPQDEGAEGAEPSTQPSLESWRFEFDLGPRGEDADGPRDVLPFLVEYDAEGERAFVLNGSERIAVPNSRRGWERWSLDFPHYDSAIELRRELNADEQTEWLGTWTKERGRAEPAVVPVRAVPEPVGRFEPVNGLSLAPGSVAGRYRVDFESGGDVPAVAVLEAGDGVELTGTFLTDTGDYRYLAGDVSSRGLRLSCFDGAHAFLFEARIEIDPVDGDRLVDGVFRSGDWWSESWTAERDDAVELPDPLARLGLRPTAHLEFLTLPDTSGAWHPLWTPGRPAVIEVFGSWCPNCHDAARLLQELFERHGDELDVVGVAFELTGEWERDARQVERFREHHDLGYRLLVGGAANKADTARALGLTDEILSYPTTFFVDANGTITAIYSGFSGPATGAAHLKVREEVEAQTRALLSIPASPPPLLESTTYWNCDENGANTERRHTTLILGAEDHPRFGASVLATMTRWTPTVHGHGGHQLEVAGRTLDRKWTEKELEVRDILQLDSPWAYGLTARLVAYDTVLLSPHDLRKRFLPTPLGQPSMPPPLEPEEVDALAAQANADEPTTRSDRLWFAAMRGVQSGALDLDPFLASLAADASWTRAQGAASLALIGAVASDAHTASWSKIDERLRTAVTDPSHLVRREAARALAAWGLGPDLLASWQASPSPFDHDLARVYAAELSAR
jgi:thiol-disulfide isomerase/thioredoxin